MELYAIILLKCSYLFMYSLKKSGSTSNIAVLYTEWVYMLSVSTVWME